MTTVLTNSDIKDNYFFNGTNSYTDDYIINIEDYDFNKNFFIYTDSCVIGNSALLTDGNKVIESSAITVNIFGQAKRKTYTMGMGNANTVTVYGSTVLNVIEGKFINDETVENSEFFLGASWGRRGKTVVYGNTSVILGKLGEDDTKLIIGPGDGDIFGSGSGDIYGSTSLVINSGKIDIDYSIAGGGAWYGSIAGDSFVELNGGIVSVDKGLYGGSHSNVDVAGNSYVIINDGCSVTASIYAGSGGYPNNYATTGGDAWITINGGEIYGSLNTGAVSDSSKTSINFNATDDYTLNASISSGFNEINFNGKTVTLTETADFKKSQLNFKFEDSDLVENSYSFVKGNTNAFSYADATTFTVNDAQVHNLRIYEANDQLYIINADDDEVTNYQIEVDYTTLYVNDEYAKYEVGDYISGDLISGALYYGYNAFSTIGECLTIAQKFGVTHTISLANDVELTEEYLKEDSEGYKDFFTLFGTDVKFTANKNVNITVNPSASDSSTWDLLWENGTSEAGLNITLDEMVSLNTNTKVWFGYRTTTEPTNYIIDGTINVKPNAEDYGKSLQVQICEASTVTLNGTITGAELGFQVSGGSLTVNADANLKLDGTIALEAGRPNTGYEGNKGTITIDGATNVSASSLTINYTNNQRSEGLDSEFAIINGSKIELTNNVIVLDGGVISVEAGSMLTYGTTFVNEGRISVDLSKADATIYQIFDYTIDAENSVDFGSVTMSDDSFYTVVNNSDLFVTNIDKSIAYVNPEYDIYEFGDAIAGFDGQRIYGINAFSEYVADDEFDMVIGGIKGEGNIHVDIDNVEMADSNGRVYAAGSYDNGTKAKVTGSVYLDIKGETSATNSIVYGGGLVKGEGTALYISETIYVDMSSSGTFGEVYGGGAIDGNSASASIEIGSVNMTISNGTYAAFVGTGTKCLSGSATVNGDTNLTITGGNFEYVVYNGAYSQGGTATVKGDCNTKISGGSFAENFYAGGLSSSRNFSTSCIVDGNVNMSIDSTDNDITFKADIYAGCFYKGIITEYSNITFTGAGDKLHFDTDSNIYGDSSGARFASCINEGSGLIFDDFTGEFDAGLGYFNRVSVLGDSKVTIGGADELVDLASVSEWEFEVNGDSTPLTWLKGENDFAGDTIKLVFDSADITGMVTVIEGEDGILNGFDNLTGVEMVINGVSQDATLDASKWSCGSYSLSINGDNDLVITLA